MELKTAPTVILLLCQIKVIRCTAVCRADLYQPGRQKSQVVLPLFYGPLYFLGLGWYSSSPPLLSNPHRRPRATCRPRDSRGGPLLLIHTCRASGEQNSYTIEKNTQPDSLAPYFWICKYIVLPLRLQNILGWRSRILFRCLVTRIRSKGKLFLIPAAPRAVA